MSTHYYHIGETSVAINDKNDYHKHDARLSDENDVLVVKADGKVNYRFEALDSNTLRLVEVNFWGEHTAERLEATIQFLIRGKSYDEVLAHDGDVLASLDITPVDDLPEEVKV